MRLVRLAEEQIDALVEPGVRAGLLHEILEACVGLKIDDAIAFSNRFDMGNTETLVAVMDGIDQMHLAARQMN